jgi:cyclophilin family peptidyl-prolyl cis-trans isomerase
MRQHTTRRGNAGLHSARSLTAAQGAAWSGESFFEGLEQRSLLANTPFPLISDLVNPNDTVVRLQTNFGDIDFELFDQAAPITVANFMKYVRDGDFDQSFFHRYVVSNNGTPDNAADDFPFVLQGGFARLHSPVTTGPFAGTGTDNAARAWEPIPTDAAITNEFNQSNLTRTIAMARIGGQVNSATSQFFINLHNNTNLDSVDQGFTVFGRVANDASWSVVTAIENGETLSDQGGVFAELPTKTGAMFNATNVTGDQLVTIRDAEIIKPQGVAAFYTYRLYYPEGFAGGHINEFLPLANPGSTTVNYQIIVRAETRDPLPTPAADFWYRDKVISTGTISANRRSGVTISTFTTPANNLVPRQGKPYGIEVWATGPIDAMLSHYDFGSSTIEAFTQNTATTWTLPDIRRGTDIKDFIVWENTSDVTAMLTVKFFQEGGATPIEVMVSTEAFRRGGLAIANLTQLTDGNYSVQITSDQPIVAAVTHYKTTGADKGGATQLGITGMGGPRGVLPLASNGAAGSGIADTFSILNPNSTGAIVTIIARFDDGSPDYTITTVGLVVMPNSRSNFTLPDVPDLQGKHFAVIYSSAANVNVYISTLHVEHGDVASNPFSYTAATHHDFGEGFMNGARAGTTLFEEIGLYNPNGTFFNASQPQMANITLRFLFNDGFVMTKDYAVGPDGFQFVDLTTLPELLAQNANGRFFFSLDVVADVPIVAMMRHYDTSLGGLQPSGGDSTIGTQRGQVLGLMNL